MKYKFLLVLVLIVLTLVVLNIYQKDIKNFFYNFSLPVERCFWRVGESTADFFANIFQTSLKDKVDALETENQALLSQLIELEELRAENKVLGEAFGAKLNEEFSLLLSDIIAKDGSFLMIDRGYSDGLAEGMAVITEGKVLAGYLETVYQNAARVRLIWDPEVSFDGKVFGQTAVSGLLTGNGDSKLVLDLIPKEAGIKEGDLVSTSSISGLFPEGLLVGVVEKINRTDLDSFQTADIIHYFDLDLSKDLFVILNHEN